jgi:hypothetical protein
VQGREAARALGYDFGQLKKGRIRRIAFLLHRQHNTLSSSPFYSPVLHGAEEACRREGIALSFIAVGPAEPVPPDPPAPARRHPVRRLFRAGTAGRPAHIGKPLVLVDMHRRGFSSVNPDTCCGGYLATRHLLRCGRKRIAMLSGSLAHYSIQQRNRGFRKALFDAHAGRPRPRSHHAAMGRRRRGRGEAMRSLLACRSRPGRRVLLQRQHGAGGHAVLPERGHEDPARHRHRRLRRHQPPRPPPSRRSASSASTRKRWAGPGSRCCSTSQTKTGDDPAVQTDRAREQLRRLRHT